jgi:hypothetical protein
MTIFEDHLVRDINAGRFSKNTSLVLVTHGLALRIFLMRWFHWTVDQVGDATRMSLLWSCSFATLWLFVCIRNDEQQRLRCT